MEYVLAFSGTSHSIRAEQALLAAGVPVTVMPLPGAIRAGCGICLRLGPEQLAAGQACLREAGIPVEGVYRKEDQNGGVSFTPVEKGE